jgi:hypothetical protein
MEVYVGVFNKLPNIKSKGYINLQLGAENSTNNITDAKDNSGDNISHKNPNYCELSGLYWIWKNASNDIVGLTHYRRFFYRHTIIFNKNNVIKEEQVEKILKNYDVIVPEEGHLFKKSIYEQYKESHNIGDLEKCGQVINKLYPDYYDTFNKVIQANHYHPFNMFIGKKQIIDEYAKWLFSVLFELENYIDITKKDRYNSRVYGFLGERLFNVWIIKNKIKIKELPVYNVESPIVKQEIISVIKNIFLKGRHFK